MTARTTFALDQATGNAVARLARLWKVSKVEAVRRSVAAAEQQAAAATGISPLEALDWLQSQGKLTESAASNWEQDSRRGWVEAWQKKGKRTASPRTRRAQ